MALSRTLRSILSLQKFYLLFFLCLSLASFAHAVHADSADQPPEKINLTTFPIPGLIDADHTGVFVDMIQEFSKRLGVEIEFEILSIKRAQKKFRDKNADAHFPITPRWKTEGQRLCLTDPIYVKRDFIFRLQHNLVSDSDRPLNIGLVTGYGYSDEILKNPAYRFEEAPDVMTNMKKLKAGRLDGVLAEELEGVHSIHALDAAKLIVYDGSQPLAETPIHIVLHATNRLHETCQAFQRVSRELHREGWLEKRFSSQQ